MNLIQAMEYIQRMAKSRKAYRLLLQGIESDTEGILTNWILCRLCEIKNKSKYGTKGKENHRRD